MGKLIIVCQAIVMFCQNIKNSLTDSYNYTEKIFLSKANNYLVYVI